MSSRKRWGCLAALGAACLIGAGSPAQAQEIDINSLLVDLIFQRNGPPPATKPAFTYKLLAKAEPDECFNGIGEPYPPINPDGTCDTGQPKTNEAYIWGLTRASNGNLWFGTAPNVVCLVVGGYFGGDDPSLNKSWVCEYGDSQYSPPLPAEVGDFRPPHAYEYNPTTKTLTERTPNNVLFQATLGLRSAGSIGGVAFLAGPALAGDGANFFAFNISDGSLIAACKATDYRDIRSWVVYKNVLHAGIGRAADGLVVKWTGTEASPFGGQTSSTNCGFQTVATIPGSAAYITTFGSDRIAVSAWPADFENPSGNGVYLVNPSTGAVKLLWKPTDYELDPIIAATYGGGAIAEWKGALYFMTMHVPGTATLFHVRCAFPPYNNPLCAGIPSGDELQQELFAATQRASSVWRITDPKAAKPKIELLYGESTLPTYNPVSERFELEPIKWKPKFGKSGFNNANNAYGWTASVVNGKLMLGMFDQAYLQTVSLLDTQPNLPIPYDLLLQQSNPSKPGLGGDLWRFDDPKKAAIPENLSGLGNYLNYGFRSMATSANGKTLYVGTANPMNLEPEGGWELIELKPKK